MHLSFRLHRINVKTAEPIGPNFFVGPHMIPGKIYGWSKFNDFAREKFRNLFFQTHQFKQKKSAKI